MTTFLVILLGVSVAAFTLFEFHRKWADLMEFIGTSFDDEGL